MASAKTLVALMDYMEGAWPVRTVRWDAEKVFPVWLRTFEECTDEEVRNAVRLLIRDEGRDQQWPPTAPEILVYVLKYRRWLIENGLDRVVME